MDDRALTGRLAEAAGVAVDAAQLAALFEMSPELTEWSLNPAADRRGALRVSAWTRDRAAGAAAMARVAPVIAPTRAALLGADGGDYEGWGLALRAGGPASARWWVLPSDGAPLAARAREAWPAQAGEIDRLLAATGGPRTCAGAGVEAGVEGAARRTIYAELRTPQLAVRVLELARVAVSRAANLFWKGICGLEPGGRPWPKVWVGRSLGRGGGWKFYYFARGDEHRRSDAVLLDAIGAGPELLAARGVLGAEGPGPWVQLVGLTILDGDEPGAAPGAATFTAYLARS